MNYTPGPWRFSTSPQPNGCPTIGAGDLLIAMLSHSIHQPEQREVALSNARLIAAAPELADAVHRLLIGDTAARSDAIALLERIA